MLISTYTELSTGSGKSTTGECFFFFFFLCLIYCAKGKSLCYTLKHQDQLVCMQLRQMCRIWEKGNYTMLRAVQMYTSPANEVGGPACPSTIFEDAPPLVLNKVNHMSCMRKVWVIAPSRGKGGRCK